MELPICDSFIFNDFLQDDDTVKMTHYSLEFIMNNVYESYAWVIIMTHKYESEIWVGNVSNNEVNDG